MPLVWLLVPAAGASASAQCDVLRGPRIVRLLSYACSDYDCLPESQRLMAIACMDCLSFVFCGGFPILPQQRVPSTSVVWFLLVFLLAIWCPTLGYIIIEVRLEAFLAARSCLSPAAPIFM